MKKSVQASLFEANPGNKSTSDGKDPAFAADAQVAQRDYFENYYFSRGYKYIAGVDEAGRGPLAGPVVAAAVIFPEGFYIDCIDDSKKLTEEKREEMYIVIRKVALSVGVGIVSERQIEKLNILNASLMAMEMAVSELETEPQFILVDGNAKIPTKIPQKTIKQGDSKSISIAAASIVAKVTRDRIMYQHHRTYPFYNFKGHKGYGTKEHIEAIRQYGVTKIHRRTFSPVKDFLEYQPQSASLDHDDI